MTTTVDPDDQSSTAETWRAIGRLEGQRKIKAAIRETNATLDTGFRQYRTDLASGLRQVNRRLDRLLYAMLAGGSVLLVAIFASRFIGG